MFCVKSCLYYQQGKCMYVFHTNVPLPSSFHFLSFSLSLPSSLPPFHSLTVYFRLASNLQSCLGFLGCWDNRCVCVCAMSTSRISHSCLCSSPSPVGLVEFTRYRTHGFERDKCIDTVRCPRKCRSNLQPQSSNSDREEQKTGAIWPLSGIFSLQSPACFLL